MPCKYNITGNTNKSTTDGNNTAKICMETIIDIIVFIDIHY